VTQALKPPPDRLYGRVKGKKLRPRQEWLLENFLPQVSWPDVPFAGRIRETWLEVGFGGGEHAHALSLANPDIGIIAAEVFETGICSLLSRLAPDAAARPLPPANLRLYTDDARPLLKDMPAASLSKIFLMFPDPWPKARHAKRRFVHPDLLHEVARVLQAKGEWRIASDDPTYQQWTDDVISAQSKLTLLHRADSRPDGWPPTRYEAKAIAAGRQPVYWSLEKNEADC
jgi:tRNA (guanine-N7-)-methyltransferase